MVLEGLNWVSRAVLSPDYNDVDIFWKFVVEYMKKGSNAKFYQFLYDFFSYVPDFFYQKTLTPS